MPNLRNGSKGVSNPGSLDCESGILPLSYCGTSALSALKAGYFSGLSHVVGGGRRHAMGPSGGWTVILVCTV